MASSPLDDEHVPLYTVGQVAEMLAVKQAFLRRVDELRVVSPRRSAGGQRRYTRYEIRVIQQVASMADEGMTLSSIRRIIGLERRLAELARERDEAVRRCEEAVRQRDEAVRRCEEAVRQRHELARRLAGLSADRRERPGGLPAPGPGRVQRIDLREVLEHRERGRQRGPLRRGEQPQAVRQRHGGLGADAFQRLMTARCDGQRARPRVGRVREPAHVAAFLQRGDQPGERGRRNPLGGRQVPEPHRPGALDRRERGKLGGRQAREMVLAEPAGKPRQGDTQPGDVDLGVVPQGCLPPLAAGRSADDRIRAHLFSVRGARRTLEYAERREPRDDRVRRLLSRPRPGTLPCGRLTDDGDMDEMASEDLAGRLLVATPMLGDPNFRRTVVLVVEHEAAQGTLGVVLNRPTKVPVGQVLEPWTDLATSPAVVFSGGPVAPNSALALALVPGTDEPVGWHPLDGAPAMARLGLIDLDAPPGLLAPAITSLRVYAGYAGWSAGQLDAEIAEGAWYVLPGEPSDAFCAEPDRLWPTVLRRQGSELALVATYPDDPAMNLPGGEGST